MNPSTHRINEQIRVAWVRVISVDGQLLGVMPVNEALTLASNAGLDLVEVAPGENPPVCRIMDYGKFKYYEQRRGRPDWLPPGDGQEPPARENGSP